MAIYRRRRTTRRRSSASNRGRSASRSRRAPTRRRAAAPQTIRIVIEQNQPAPPFGPTHLPDQVGGVQAMTTPRRNRF